MRKTITVTLMDEETPLKFEITQMSATQKERWILYALFLLGSKAGNSGIDFDSDNIMGELQTKGLALFDGLSVDDVQPLLDGLLACCTRVNGSARWACTPDSVDGYISDVKTLFNLRVESFKVNFPDFFTKKPATEAEKENPSNSEARPPITLKIPR